MVTQKSRADQLSRSNRELSSAHRELWGLMSVSPVVEQHLSIYYEQLVQSSAMRFHMDPRPETVRLTNLPLSWAFARLNTLCPEKPLSPRQTGVVVHTTHIECSRASP